MKTLSKQKRYKAFRLICIVLAATMALYALTSLFAVIGMYGILSSQTGLFASCAIISFVVFFYTSVSLKNSKKQTHTFPTVFCTITLYYALFLSIIITFVNGFAHSSLENDVYMSAMFVSFIFMLSLILTQITHKKFTIKYVSKNILDGLQKIFLFSSIFLAVAAVVLVRFNTPQEYRESINHGIFPFVFFLYFLSFLFLHNEKDSKFDFSTVSTQSKVLISMAGVIIVVCFIGSLLLYHYAYEWRINEGLFAFVSKYINN